MHELAELGEGQLQHVLLQSRHWPRVRELCNIKQQYCRDLTRRASTHPLHFNWDALKFKFEHSRAATDEHVYLVFICFLCILHVLMRHVHESGICKNH